MSETLVIALLATLGVIVAAFCAGAATLAVALARWYVENRLLWLWNRQLVDHIYRGLGPPPPGAPDGLLK
ncbi:MAG TPA: hypothetical protein VFU07_09640 [Candidatus Lumbricidophila sp.]|nr:hypothetical protein [Candidatus Lumbricidophila sp.]